MQIHEVYPPWKRPPIRLLCALLHSFLIISSFVVLAADPPIQLDPKRSSRTLSKPNKPAHDTQAPLNRFKTWPPTKKDEQDPKAQPGRRRKNSGSPSPRSRSDSLSDIGDISEPHAIDPDTFPGPTRVTAAPAIPGVTPIHTWIAATEPGGVLTTYTVSTPSPKPTLVYNCQIVPALCNAAQKHLGDGVTTTTLVYDRWIPERVNGVTWTGGSRTSERRTYACGNGRNLLPQAQHRPPLQCPAVNVIIQGRTVQKAQPPTFTVQSGIRVTTTIGNSNKKTVETVFTPAVFPGNIIMTSMTTKAAGLVVTSTLENQLAVETRLAGGERKKVKIPYKLSCEEFPPATSVQGGLGAETYCVQIKRSKGFDTEQNWQGLAVLGLRNYAQKPIHGFDPHQRGNYTAMNTLFEYAFEMRYSSGRGAVWVEGDGRPEYCYGPWGPSPEDCQEISIPMAIGADEDSIRDEEDAFEEMLVENEDIESDIKGPISQEWSEGNRVILNLRPMSFDSSPILEEEEEEERQIELGIERGKKGSEAELLELESENDSRLPPSRSLSDLREEENDYTKGDRETKSLYHQQLNMFNRMGSYAQGLDQYAKTILQVKGIRKFDIEQLVDLSPALQDDERHSAYSGSLIKGQDDVTDSIKDQCRLSDGPDSRGSGSRKAWPSAVERRTRKEPAPDVDEYALDEEIYSGPPKRWKKICSDNANPPINLYSGSGLGKSSPEQDYEKIINSDGVQWSSLGLESNPVDLESEDV
ncbi:hypothetical protein TWF730_010063 [Orbilia blumenaviensis]|uniref:Uncharacterized protein n=1 Tax=Orbilia blumenaviensis TaxID=1796055 RepID=A0AAV9UUK7_9PEZI